MKFFRNRLILLLAFTSLFLSVNCEGQEVSKNNNEMDVMEINKQCEKINTDTSSFTIAQKDIFDLSSEGGFLRTYYEGRTLRKAILTLFGENGQSTEEYYLLDNKLIYLYESGIRYTDPFYLKQSEIKSEQTNRYFFKDLKLIKWTDSVSKIVDQSLYYEKQTEILEYFNTYILKSKSVQPLD